VGDNINSTNQNSDRILVVGAGPVGLFAATRLAGFNIPVTLIDASETVSDDIRASTIHPPTLDMMEPYGISAEAVAGGIQVREWQIRLHTTGEKAVFDMGCISDVTDYPYRLQFEQSQLCRIMDRMLRQNDLVDIHYGTRLVSFDQDENGVTATLERSGEPQKMRTKFLIAADGATSTVREQLDLAFEGSMYPERTVLVTTSFPFHEHLDGISSVSYCWDAEGNFSLLQLPARWRVSMYFPQGLTPEEAIGDAHIEDRLQSICRSDTPYEVIDKRVYRVHQRIVERYDHGRVVLAGDAAHLNSPTGGMGMNGGLHDAHNLTEKLNTIWHVGGDLSLLSLYSRQRKPIAEREIIQQADRNRRRMTEKDPEKRRAHLQELQATVSDPDKLRAYLMKSSMYDGLAAAAAIT
jgi:2-polyprenyl-6-methoxyphenol hydroxylase-like FAD-dependent oxidoreductase